METPNPDRIYNYLQLAGWLFIGIGMIFALGGYVLSMKHDWVGVGCMVVSFVCVAMGVGAWKIKSLD